MAVALLFVFVVVFWPGGARGGAGGRFLALFGRREACAKL